MERPVNYPADGDPKDECHSDPQVVDNSAKDFNGLTDIYWVCYFLALFSFVFLPHIPFLS